MIITAVGKHLSRWWRTYHEILLASTQAHKIQDTSCRQTSVQVHAQLGEKKNIKDKPGFMLLEIQIEQLQTYAGLLQEKLQWY